MSADSPPELELRDLRKVFRGVVAVDGASLTINRGELVSLLGPSGCGKTTTLRIIAGFEIVSSGRVILRGRDVTNMPPHRRSTGMMFQNYALFPHLNVFENIAFGLRRSRVAKENIQKRVGAMMDFVSLQGLERRFPRELSGGQQQRVALARALVIEPAVLLLDEPLSNLDAKLRAATRVELRRLQQEIGVTTVFVTHDQDEAMTVSDRIAVMNAGRIEQIGSAQQIYERPASEFVALFLGTSNVLKGAIVECDHEYAALQTACGLLRGRIALSSECAVNKDARMLVRAERLSIIPDESLRDPTMNRVAGVVELDSYLGARSVLSVRADDGSLLAVESSAQLVERHPKSSRVTLHWTPDDCLVFTP